MRWCDFIETTTDGNYLFLCTIMNWPERDSVGTTVRNAIPSLRGSSTHYNLSFVDLYLHCEDRYHFWSVIEIILKHSPSIRVIVRCRNSLSLGHEDLTPLEPLTALVAERIHLSRGTGRRHQTRPSDWLTAAGQAIGEDMAACGKEREDE